MTEAPEQPQYVWTCRTCRRKMPVRLDICRCGTRRDAGSPDEPASVIAAPKDSAPLPQSRASGSSLLQWMVLLTVAAIAIGSLVAIQVVPVRNSASTMARSGPATPAPPPTSDAAEQDYS